VIANYGLSLCVYKTLSIFFLLLVILHYVVKTDTAYCVLTEWGLWYLKVMGSVSISSRSAL
jgi:hypothetical protein